MALMRQLSLLFLVCSLCAVASAQEAYVATFFGFHDGKQFAFTITPEHLKNSPEWLDGQEHPPLSARRALLLATAYLPKLAPHAEKLKMHEIRLRQVRDKWVYVVEFSERKEGVKSGFVIVVLMNGEVVEPKITKRKLS